MKNRKWDMGKKLPMPNAPSPKRRGAHLTNPKENGVSRRFQKKEVVKPPLSSNQETQTF
ncbi:hypothetical protein NIES37_13940 [Tolypothrix tenuis PCC 7101]|uniref:Uncharacterized protein n=1 Tax=Tolypothrix tenuis PCC 7101 TaxID=231146 RepID=A0A1Z4MVF1_9CYAN|nr:hypothetical protein NIES37_13940 [Tolypothrix tenuis PCC 7101]BAZ72039.1 hypothetical protein NIES50_05880 [Aulosira laxa NIES-50]